MGGGVARGRLKEAQCDTCRVGVEGGAAGVTDGEQSQRGGGARNVMKPEEEQEALVTSTLTD